jgi:hypothetical protein
MNLENKIIMKNLYLLIILLFLTVTSFGQDKKNHYRWMQYGIEFITEDSLEIVESDMETFRCDGKESTLWISKLNTYLTPIEREKYLKEWITEIGFRVVGRVVDEMKDSIIIYSTRAENNKNYGYIFIFSDSLAKNNLFSGYFTTGSKPEADIMKLIDFKTFKADPTIKALPKKSAQSLTVNTNEDHELIKDIINSDSLIIGKENISKEVSQNYQKYSTDVDQLMKTYNALPEKLGARNIGTHEDISTFFKDTIELKSLFLNTTFVHETYHNVNKWMSVLQSIKKTKGNYTDKIYSLFLFDSTFVHAERIVVPPANIIHKSFPSQFKKNDLYPLYIYPSSLNNATQLTGIYTLLDEFGANILELAWQNNILQMYYDRNLKNISFFGSYLSTSPGAFSDAISFKMYILHYLSILKTTNNALYQQLMNDLNLKKVLVVQDQKLTKEILAYNSSKNKIRDALGEEYVPYIENEEKLTLDKWYWKNAELVTANKMIEYINNQPDYQIILKEIDCSPMVPLVLITE